MTGNIGFWARSESFRLMEHPSDLGERQESRRRLEALIPVIEAVRTGYEAPNNAESCWEGIKALRHFQEDVSKILKRLGESIEAEEVSEKLENV